MRSFRAGLSQAFQLGSLPVTAYPFSVGLIFAQTAIGASDADMAIFSFSDSAVSTDGHRLMYYGTSGGFGSGFSARTTLGGTDREGKVAMTVTTGIYYWILGVWADASDRRVYVVDVASGVATAQNTLSITPTFDTADIGRFRAGGTPTKYLSGQVGYLSVWDYAFSTQEVTDYWGHGTASQRNWIDPRRIFPGNLKMMWQARRLPTTSANDVDNWAGITLTNVGNPANIDEPPMLRSLPLLAA